MSSENLFHLCLSLWFAVNCLPSFHLQVGFSHALCRPLCCLFCLVWWGEDKRRLWVRKNEDLISNVAKFHIWNLLIASLLIYWEWMVFLNKIQECRLFAQEQVKLQGYWQFWFSKAYKNTHTLAFFFASNINHQGELTHSKMYLGTFEDLKDYFIGRSVTGGSLCSFLNFHNSSTFLW